jgi:rRNA biogenesis protein RRP5
MGRLVVGKVKAIHEVKKRKLPCLACKYTVDLDLRESSLADVQTKLSFDDIAVGSKHKGTITRIEDYGVFVRLENSRFSGLVHKSECSDDFVKNLADLYDPGDFVKVLVLKKNAEKQQLGFSMKPSHFEGDEESDSEASVDDEMSANEGAAVEVKERSESESDDDNFVTKLASKINAEHAESDDDESSSSEETRSDDSSSSSESSETLDRHALMDTDVGFDWDGLDHKRVEQPGDDSEDDSEETMGEEDNEMHKSSHKSRRKHAQRLREEQEIARRESALADGTADENPETASDFERLLAASPNSSELWIRVSDTDYFVRT